MINNHTGIKQSRISPLLIRHSSKSEGGKGGGSARCAAARAGWGSTLTAQGGKKSEPFDFFSNGTQANRGGSDFNQCFFSSGKSKEPSRRLIKSTFGKSKTSTISTVGAKRKSNIAAPKKCFPPASPRLRAQLEFIQDFFIQVSAERLKKNKLALRTRVSAYRGVGKSRNQALPSGAHPWPGGDPAISASGGLNRGPSARRRRAGLLGWKPSSCARLLL